MLKQHRNYTTRSFRKPRQTNACPKSSQHRPGSIVPNAYESGDFVTRCVLCGDTTNLKSIMHDKANESIANIFLVKVPCEGMICESCVKCLKNTERFRALVLASFKEDTTISQRTNSNYTNCTSSKDIIELLKTRVQSDLKKRRIDSCRSAKKKYNLYGCEDAKMIRRIVRCTVCHQKYPVMCPGGIEKGRFVCSRCSRNRPGHNLRSVSETVNIVDKLDNSYSIKSRGTSVRSKPLKESTHAHIPKYKCPLCKKQFIIHDNLTNHILRTHEDFGQKQSFNMKKTINTPKQCKYCMRLIHSPNTLQMHNLTCRKRRAAPRVSPSFAMFDTMV